MLMFYYIMFVCYFCYVWKIYNEYIIKCYILFFKLLSKNVKMFYVYVYILQEIILIFE